MGPHASNTGLHPQSLLRTLSRGNRMYASCLVATSFRDSRCICFLTKSCLKWICMGRFLIFPCNHQPLLTKEESNLIIIQNISLAPYFEGGGVHLWHRGSCVSHQIYLRQELYSCHRCPISLYLFPDGGLLCEMRNPFWTYSRVICRCDSHPRTSLKRAEMYSIIISRIRVSLVVIGRRWIDWMYYITRSQNFLHNVSCPSIL